MGGVEGERRFQRGDGLGGLAAVVVILARVGEPNEFVGGFRLAGRHGEENKRKQKKWERGKQRAHGALSVLRVACCVLRAIGDLCRILRRILSRFIRLEINKGWDLVRGPWSEVRGVWCAMQRNTQHATRRFCTRWFAKFHGVK